MKFKVALTIFAVLFTAASLGKDKVTLEASITVEANASIHFEVPVGSLDITTYNGDEIIIKVEVEEADNDWFSSPDLSEAQIEIDNSGDKVHLEIDMEDVVQKWEVKIPHDANLDIDLGVGGIEIEDFERDAIIDVGVGEIDITLSSDNYREIELGAGVGDVDLDGFKAFFRHVWIQNFPVTISDSEAMTGISSRRNNALNNRHNNASRTQDAAMRGLYLSLGRIELIPPFPSV